MRYLAVLAVLVVGTVAALVTSGPGVPFATFLVAMLVLNGERQPRRIDTVLRLLFTGILATLGWWAAFRRF